MPPDFIVYLLVSRKKLNTSFASRGAFG